MSIAIVREKVLEEEAGSGARQTGEILLAICEASEQAAELVAQDLDQPEMSLSKCFTALYDFAKKNQKGGAWSCGGMGLDPENPVIKVILDFYKVKDIFEKDIREGPLGGKVNWPEGTREGPLGGKVNWPEGTREGPLGGKVNWPEGTREGPLGGKIPAEWVGGDVRRGGVTPPYNPNSQPVGRYPNSQALGRLNQNECALGREPVDLLDLL